MIWLFPVLRKVSRQSVMKTAPKNGAVFLGRPVFVKRWRKHSIIIFRVGFVCRQKNKSVFCALALKINY